MADGGTIKEQASRPLVGSRDGVAAGRGHLLAFPRAAAATSRAAAEQAQRTAIQPDPALRDAWLLYCEAVARLRKAAAASTSPARAEALLRLTLPRLMRQLDRDWDRERRLLDAASRRVFDDVLFDCLRLRPAQRRRARRQGGAHARCRHTDGRGC